MRTSPSLAPVVCALLLTACSTRSVPVAVDDVSELRANVSALWSALNELQAEVKESFDIHTAIENHEHNVHHLGHEDTDHEIHHSEKHLNHLEQVHGKTLAGATPVEAHKPHTPEEKELLRHEHHVHHANGSHETAEEHASHHDEAVLTHLEQVDGFGDHKGVHHGKEKSELAHEIGVHFGGQEHHDHAGHHSERLLKHLEDDDGHGPAPDRPTQTPAKPTLRASCEMKTGRPLRAKGINVQGTVTLEQPDGGHLTFRANLKGLRGASHGLMVHTSGDCTWPGDHFNPTNQQHGTPDHVTRHVGDLGTVPVKSDGTIDVTRTDKIASLDGPHSIVSRTLVLHEKPDGYLGRRLACCVVRQL